jgi:hypothetical protein
MVIPGAGPLKSGLAIVNRVHLNVIEAKCCRFGRPSVVHYVRSSENRKSLADTAPGDKYE